MKKNLFAFFVFSFQTLYSQDIHFSQNVSPFAANPALVGNIPDADNLRFTAVSRSQWASVARQEAYQTYIATYDQRVSFNKANHLGIGVQIVHDQAGGLALKNTQAHLAAAYLKLLGATKKYQHYLAAGTQIGIANRRLDFSRATWGEQFTGKGYDTSLPTGETTLRTDQPRWFGDIGVGIQYHKVVTKRHAGSFLWFNIGLGFHHLHLGNTVKDKLLNTSLLNNQVWHIPHSLTVHTATAILFKNDFLLMPSAVVSWQNRSWDIVAGFYGRVNMPVTVRLKALQTGLLLRVNNAAGTHWGIESVIPSFRLDMSPFVFLMGYDVNVSKLREASRKRGGFELGLVYKLQVKDDDGHNPYQDCYSF